MRITMTITRNCIHRCTVTITVTSLYCN